MEKPSDKLVRIFTHVRADIDAACSVWAIIRFALKLKRSSKFNFWTQLVQKDANWDGTGSGESDYIVDIKANGKGIKGAVVEGKVESAFLAVMEKFASIEDQIAFQNAICFVNEHDSTGDAVYNLFSKMQSIPLVDNDARSIIADCTLVSSFHGFQNVYRNDTKTIAVFCDMLDGMLDIQIKMQKARNNYAQYTTWYHCNQIVVARNAPMTVSRVVFEKRARVLIYSDGNNLGIQRNNKETIRMDHPKIKAVVKKYGELDEWFAHEVGFLFCRGSNKAPRNTPSKVPINELVKAIISILEEESVKKKKIFSVKKTLTKLIEA